MGPSETTSPFSARHSLRQEGTQVEQRPRRIGARASSLTPNLSHLFRPSFHHNITHSPIITPPPSSNSWPRTPVGIGPASRRKPTRSVLLKLPRRTARLSFGWLNGEGHAGTGKGQPRPASEPCEPQSNQASSLPQTQRRVPRSKHRRPRLLPPGVPLLDFTVDKPYRETRSCRRCSTPTP